MGSAENISLQRVIPMQIHNEADQIPPEHVIRGDSIDKNKRNSLQLTTDPFKTGNKHFYNMLRPTFYQRCLAKELKALAKKNNYTRQQLELILKNQLLKSIQDKRRRAGGRRWQGQQDRDKSEVSENVSPPSRESDELSQEIEDLRALNEGGMLENQLSSRFTSNELVSNTSTCL